MPAPKGLISGARTAAGLEHCRHFRIMVRVRIGTGGPGGRFVRFTVLPAKASAPYGADVAFLEWNSWDDFGFQTSFELYYRDAGGTIHYLGAVKIGSFDMGRDRGPDIPGEFDRLDDRFFSLGQDDSYYAQLTLLQALVTVSGRGY